MNNHLHSIKKAAVIGAGTMGAGIAGQLANAGVDVLLMDLPSTNGDRNALSNRGLERLKDEQMPGLIHEDVAQSIRICNTEDDFDLLSEVDWVAEAVIERLDVKIALYKRLYETCAAHTIVTSNTSTIPISLLTQGMPNDFKKRFAITHFFNPVRYMRLLELVGGEDTDKSVLSALGDFCDTQLGKGVIHCADTPGFLANRMGVYSIQVGIDEAIKCGLTVEEADAIVGRPMGIPKTGVFGLYDLIGLDLMVDVVASLKGILPPGDAFHDVAEPADVIKQLIQHGYTGNKGDAGFYRSVDEDNFAVDLNTGTYRPKNSQLDDCIQKAQTAGIEVLLSGDDKFSKFSWNVLCKMLAYACSLVPEVTDSPLAIDDAMKLGYNWEKGPFEMIDAIGADRLIEALNSRNMPIPGWLANQTMEPFYRTHDSKLQVKNANSQFDNIARPPGVIRFQEYRKLLSKINGNDSATLWSLRNDLVLVEFHTKANALDAQSMEVMAQGKAYAEKHGTGIILHNDGPHFSCGVNLEMVRRHIEAKDWLGIDKFLNDFQQTCLGYKYAKVPIIAAPHGLSIGGGFEVVLHAHASVYHANSVTGLVESLVGLIPGGGGCKEMFYRWTNKLSSDVSNDVRANGSQPPADIVVKAAWKTFMNIGYGKTARSPLEAEALAMFNAKQDRWIMNRDRLLQSAMQRYDNEKMNLLPQKCGPLPMPGRVVYEEMEAWLIKAHNKGVLTPHDINVGKALAEILTGGDIEANTLLSEQDLYDLERKVFVELAQTQQTYERICHLLDRGTALRN